MRLMFFALGVFHFLLIDKGYSQIPPSFKHFTINDGLSQNTVFCIFQDSKGFIWFGTEDGLNRFDGYEFKIFKEDADDSRSLVNNQINTIIENDKGDLIIGSAGGISIFKRNTQDFDNIILTSLDANIKSINFITAIVPHKNKLWLATFDGLRLLNLETKKLEDNVFTKRTNKRKVHTVYRTGDGRLWASFDKSISCFDTQNQKEISPPKSLAEALLNNPSDIRVIKQDKNSNIWLGTEQSGLFYYNKASDITINYLPERNNSRSLPINVVRDIYFHKKDEVWIATRNGLSILNLKTNQFTNYTHNKYNPESLSHRSVLRIMKDKAGNIWLGTFAGGVNLYTPTTKNFIKIGEDLGDFGGLNNSVVSAVAHEDNGALWVGTEGGGLNYINRNKTVFEAYSLKKHSAEPSENLIKSIAKDEKGNLWIGAYEGLFYFETASKKMKPVLVNQQNVSGRSQVYSVLSDDGGVWAGTNGGGLVYYHLDKVIKVYTNNPADTQSISSNHISSLLKDKQGNLWVGTVHGINYFNKTTGKFTQFVYHRNNNLNTNNDNVTSLFVDSKNRLWVATRGKGLNVFEQHSRKFQSFTEKDGLANNVVRAINEDNAGRIWVSSNKGISVIDFSETPLPKIRSVRNYTIADGILSNQFLSGSTDKLADGTLIFGGINGLTIINPLKITTNKHIPEIVFTEFYINNKPINIKSKDSPISINIDEIRAITLPYDQSNITIKFAALNFTNPDKNKYAYRLEGFSNEEWQEIGGQRTVSFTNLNAGKYEFMVKAANDDSVWNNKPAIIKITILPPWYKTWWAYMFYLVIISTLLYYFYYFSNKTIRLKNELYFEQLNHEKDQELAQRKLSFFTYISHEIKTPLTLILSPLEKILSLDVLDNKVRSQLQLIERNAERLMRISNQILDYRKFDSGSMALQVSEGNIVLFLNELLAAFQSYADTKEIELKLIAQSECIIVWFDRDKMEKIIYNLISNSLKFTSGGGYVHVIVEKEELATGKEQLILIVEDNGTGIPPENLDSIFEKYKHFDSDGKNSHGTGLGLSFSKELILLHHGEIKVKSTPELPKQKKGLTQFIIKLPIAKEYFKDNEIIQNYTSSEEISAYDAKETVLIKSKIEGLKQNVVALLGKEKLIMLIVEDNEEVMSFVKDHFKDDFEIHTAEDGEQGWVMAIKIIPDIIISDVMMPKMLGTALCVKLKSDFRVNHIPVILLTAREPLLFKIEGLETGADDYITKPFNLKYLEMRVWNLIESRVKLRERYRNRFGIKPMELSVISPDEKFLEKVVKFIEENIAEPILNVEDLSKKVGMSKSTLYRKLKALTNQNTNEFIRNERLNIAAQMLAQKKFNVNEVAYHVGFSNIDYFRKCFKEKFGTNPKDYSSRQNES